MSRNFRLGIFIILALVIFAAGIFLIGSKEFLFSRTYRIYAPFDNVSGLNNGAEVRVGGVHVGTVDHIRMPQNPKDKVTVAMDLQRSTQKVVRKDSIASILTEGLLGNKYVSVSFGSGKAAPIQEGDTIKSQPPVDFSDLIQKSGEVLDTTAATLENVQMATGHLKSISGKIDSGKGTLGRLINDPSVYTDVNKTMQQARVGVTAFQEDMQALKKNWFFRGFFNDRGYIDSSQLTQNEIGELPKKSQLKKFIYPAKTLFDKENSAKLKNEKALKEAGQFLEGTPFSMVVVLAYRGQPGEKQQSLELSRAQAMVVRKYLVEHFKIDDTRVKTKGLGETGNPKEEMPDRLEIVVYG